MLSVFECFSGLIYAPAIKPASRLKTAEEINPYLFGDYSFSNNQIHGCLEFLDTGYHTIVELYTQQTGKYRIRKIYEILFDSPISASSLMLKKSGQPADQRWKFLYQSAIKTKTGPVRGKEHNSLPPTGPEYF